MAMPSQRTSSPDMESAIHRKRPMAMPMAKYRSVMAGTSPKVQPWTGLSPPAHQAKPDEDRSADDDRTHRDEQGNLSVHVVPQP